MAGGGAVGGYKKPALPGTPKPPGARWVGIKTRWVGIENPVGGYKNRWAGIKHR